MLLAAFKVVWAYAIRLPPGGNFEVSAETGFKDGTVRGQKKRARVVADAEQTKEIARELLGLEC